MTRILSIPLLIALIVAACGAGPDQSAPAGLDGSWQLASGVIQEEPITLLDSHPITLNIDGTMVGGTAACNSYGGEWGLDGSKATFGNLAQTEMACQPDEAMDLESLYLQSLSQVTMVNVDGGQLVLTGPGLELRFDHLELPPTAELLGTVWELESLLRGDAVSSVSGDPTLEFFTDGSFLATTGCRNVTGNYVENGAEIAVTSMTAHGNCTPDLETQDGSVITVLEGGYRVAIDGQRLTLTIAGDEGLVYRARQTN